MEKTTGKGERIGSVEDPIVLKSVEKDVLEGLEGTVNKDGNGDDRAVITEKVEEGIDNKEKTEGSDGENKERTEKEDGSEDDKKKRVKKEDDADKKEKEEKKEKKEKKDRENRGSKKDKEKVKSDKEEKKKDKKEKKSKKSNVEKIQKKLEKIHAKIERILAKKEEYVQRLAEAQEKDRQEKERLSAEKAANQERDLATATKSSSERHGDGIPEGEVREEAAFQSSAKHPDEEIPTPIFGSSIDTTEKKAMIPEEKVITDLSKKVEDVKDTSGQDVQSNDGESGALSFSA